MEHLPVFSDQMREAPRRKNTGAGTVQVKQERSCKKLILPH